MHNDQFSSLSASSLYRKRSRSQSPLCSCSCSCSCSSSKSYENHHVEQRPNAGVRTPRMMMTVITIAQIRAIVFLLPSLLQRQRKINAPRDRESRQQSTNSHLRIRMISTNSYTRIHIIHLIRKNSHVQIYIFYLISTNSHVKIHTSLYVSLFQIRNAIV